MDLQPRFDYGRAKHKTEPSQHGAVLPSNHMRLTVHMVGSPDCGREGSLLTRSGNGVRGSWTMRQAETAGVVLESMGGALRRIQASELVRLLDDTTQFWRDWLHRSTYRGRWHEMVTRSAMTLKLLTYAPTCDSR